MFFKKHGKKLIIAFSILFAVGISVFSGYYLARNDDLDAEPSPAGTKSVAEDENSAMPVAVNDGRVGRDAKIYFAYYYERCGHTIEKQIDATEDMIGLTREQFAELYPDAEITEFSPNAVHVKQRFSQYCPKHLILKQHENGLAIFKTVAGTERMELYMRIAVDFDSLAADDQAVLKTGRMFNSLEDIEAYIEDIES